MAVTMALLGQQVRLERLGVDGDIQRAAALIKELDGQVDAIGLGGLDIYVDIAQRRYVLQQAAVLASAARVTPVVCGAGLKQSLERQAVAALDAQLHWPGRRVLMVSAVDRYGMAEALQQAGAQLRIGDVLFALGLPLVLPRLSTLRVLARLLLPVVRYAPIAWLYPQPQTSQDSAALMGSLWGRVAQRYRDVLRDYIHHSYRWAEVIAGDWHYIARYLPERLEGKTILTNTTTPEDITMLRQRGLAALITTTPRLQGRSLPTNVLEAALVAVAGRFPLSRADYDALIARAHLQPVHWQPAK